MQEKFFLKGLLQAELLIKLQWQRLKMYAQYQTPLLNFKLTLFKEKFFSFFI